MVQVHKLLQLAALNYLFLYGQGNLTLRMDSLRVNKEQAMGLERWLGGSVAQWLGGSVARWLKGLPYEHRDLSVSPRA